MKIQRVASWSGMLGTLLFTLSFTVNGLFSPGYSPVRMYVSELSIGSTGWIQIASFMVLGAALFLFALGLRSAFPSRAGFVLFSIIGISYFLSGPFVTDPAAMFDNQQTPHGIIHGIFGALVFSLSAAACFVFWRRFRKDEKWKPLSALSLICGTVMAVLIVLMKIGQLQTGLLSDYAGVVQRFCLIASYVWIFAVSVKIRYR